MIRAVTLDLVHTPPYALLKSLLLAISRLIVLSHGWLQRMPGLSEEVNREFEQTLQQMHIACTQLRGCVELQPGAVFHALSVNRIAAVSL